MQIFPRYSAAKIGGTATLFRETLLNEVWGDDSYANSNALNVQITYLRRALRSDTSITIEAIIRKGYILHEINQ